MTSFTDAPRVDDMDHNQRRLYFARLRYAMTQSDVPESLKDMHNQLCALEDGKTKKHKLQEFLQAFIDGKVKEETPHMYALCSCTLFMNMYMLIWHTNVHMFSST